MNQLSQMPTPAAGEYILVSSDNSMNAAGQGNFDCYIEGDNTHTASELELKSINDLVSYWSDDTIDSENVTQSMQAKGNVGSAISFASWSEMNYYRFEKNDGDVFYIEGKSGSDVASSLIQFVDSNNIITRRFEVSLARNTVFRDFVSFEDGETSCFVTYLRSYGLTIKKNIVTSVNALAKKTTSIESFNKEVGDILFGDGIVDITNKFYFTNGGFINSSGVVATSSIQKYSNFVDISECGDSFYMALEITDNPAVSQRYAFYNASKTLIEARTFPVSSAKGYTISEVDIPNGAKYIRTSFWIDTTLGIFSASRILHSNFTEVQNITKEMQDIMNSDGSIDITDKFSFTEGYLIRYYDGALVQSTANKASSFVDVRGYKSIEVTIDVSAAPDAITGIAFYDENKNFLVGTKCASGSVAGAKFETYEIPSNAAYVRTSYWADISTHGNIPFSCTARNAFVASIYDAIDKTGGQKMKFEPLIGSPSIYLSNSTSSEGSLNSKTVAEVYARYDAMVANFPLYVSRESNLCSITSDGTTWDVRVYKFGFNKLIVRDEEGTNETTYDNLYNDNLDNKRTILITCGMHGNEKTPWWGAMLAFEELLASDEEWAKYIKANFFFYVIPCLNPYGLDHTIRNNENNVDLNRTEGANETARVALTQWVSAKKDIIYYWMDVHGTQGRWAYVPCHPLMPFYHQVKQAVFKMTQALCSAFGDIWTSVSPSYSDYSPYLFMERGGWIVGGCAPAIYATTGVNEHAIETPDSLSTGAIGTNDGVGCAITKMLMWNMVQMLGSTQLVTESYKCHITGTISANGTLYFTDSNGVAYTSEIVNNSYDVSIPNGLYTLTCSGYTIENNVLTADQDKVVDLIIQS